MQEWEQRGALGARLGDWTACMANVAVEGERLDLDGAVCSLLLSDN